MIRWLSGEIKKLHFSPIDQLFILHKVLPRFARQILPQRRPVEDITEDDEYLLHGIGQFEDLQVRIGVQQAQSLVQYESSQGLQAKQIDDTPEVLNNSVRVPSLSDQLYKLISDFLQFWQEGI